MTNKNKLQDAFAETCDKLNDAYVFCQKELSRLVEDNNNLRLENLKLKEFLSNNVKDYIDSIDWNVDNSEFFEVIDELVKGEDK